MPRAPSAWFPIRDRAFATGLFNSGSNVGALLVYLHSWQAAF